MNLLKTLPLFVRKRKIIRRVQPFTLVNKIRMDSLWELAHRVEVNQIPGDVVECGVYNGGTAAILAHFATTSPLNRTVWLFDSFEGMPKVSADDGNDAAKYVGQVVGSIEKVRYILNKVQADANRVKIVKGHFHETFQTIRIPRIAFLNIDADWYVSVKLCLERFYDAVVPGGIISIDDYGHWSGCKQAVDEFFKVRNLNYTLNKVDYTARWLIKE